MLIPRRVKHRKQHRPKRSGNAKGGTAVAFGDFGLQATEGGYVTNRQIEAARIAMTRHTLCAPTLPALGGGLHV